MSDGYVISDLHLFTRRTVADAYRDDMHAAAARADFFVLNGDIFDFRWTTLPDIDETVAAALAWLGDFASRFPRCRFFYVLGNHDGIQPLADRLGDLAAATPNLEWSPSHVRVGRALFLHGDLPLHNGGTQPFTRLLPATDKKKGRAWNLGYHAFVALRLHRWAAKVHGKQRPNQSIKSNENRLL